MRKLTSLTLLISFLLLLFTSIILYIEPHGRVAYWSDWRFWGLDKNQWDDLHLNLGILFLAAGIIHLFYNWRPLIHYLRNRARKLSPSSPALLASLAICLAVAVGTLYPVPPMSLILDLGESIKDRAGDRYGEPPYGHAELSPLNLLCKKTGMDLETAMAALTSGGIREVSPDITLLALAQKNGTTPKELFARMRQAAGAATRDQSFPDSPPPGFGRRTINEICDQYSLHPDQVLAALKEKGIKASPDKSLKEVAADNHTDPHALFTLFHEISVQ